jgi:hypothetical protein
MQTLVSTVEIVDAVVAAAAMEGVTPQDWVIARLSERAAVVPATMAEQFAGRIGRIASGSKVTLSENAGNAFAEHLAQKRAEGSL